MAAKTIQKRKIPRLAGRVVEAIHALHESEGATTKCITDYLQTNFKTGPKVTEKEVAVALRKAVDKGKVEVRGGRFKAVMGGLTAVDAMDGRRRRRSRSRGRRRRSRSRRNRSRKGSRGGRRRRSRSRRRRNMNMNRE
ncbi:uncharacterized protein LOC124153176 [Ischnura elegans]|uniref:uncharacterized protein LOC124153176 n=1 Tax=Ischnura elegans TaxID=197161 RepID=UPI001ED8956A|nr:uncharacterized protein LOC124153176 [Ischnura elegans]